MQEKDWKEIYKKMSDNVKKLGIKSIDEKSKRQRDKKKENEYGKKSYGKGYYGYYDGQPHLDTLNDVGGTDVGTFDGDGGE